MRISDKFEFGKYKGLTLKQVFQGAPTINMRLLQEYLDKMLNHNADGFQLFSEQLNYKLLKVIYKFEITENQINVFGIYLSPKSYFKKRLKIMNFEPFLWDYLSDILEIKTFYLTHEYEQNEVKENSEPRLPLAGDPSYIFWCIENVNHFFVETDDLMELEKLIVHNFKGFHIEFKNYECYEYKPSFDEQYIKFSDKIKDINKQKEQFNSCGKQFYSKLNNDCHYLDLYEDYPEIGEHENPWRNIMGEEEEASMAYWNTD